MNITDQHETPVGDSNSIIDITSKNKSYRIGNIEVPILQNINVTIKEGEFVAIMGPSGSEKSTLMNLVGCLDRPTDGQIIMRGKDINKISDNELAILRGCEIGFIFQKFNQIPRLSALQNVELPTYANYKNSTNPRIRAIELLKLVGLDYGLLLSLTTFGTTPRLHTSRFTLGTLLTTLRFLGPKGTAWLVGRTASKDKAVRARLKPMYEMVSKDALELITMNIADYDYMDILCRHDIPMMLMKGGLDREINKNLDYMLELMGQKPSFELVEMLNAGHFANMENPVDFNEILGRFLVKQSIRSYL